MTDAPLEQISYSVPMLALATGLSESRIKEAIASGDLEVRYSGVKRVVMKEAAAAWIRSLPTELVR